MLWIKRQGAIQCVCVYERASPLLICCLSALFVLGGVFMGCFFVLFVELLWDRKTTVDTSLNMYTDVWVTGWLAGWLV